MAELLRKAFNIAAYSIDDVIIRPHPSHRVFQKCPLQVWEEVEA